MPTDGACYFTALTIASECLRLVHCQIGQNLAVEDDALGVEFADKLRIGHSLRADGCVDTHDPQAAECSLLEPGGVRKHTANPFSTVFLATVHTVSLNQSYPLASFKTFFSLRVTQQR